MNVIKNFELKLYLEGWVDNVGIGPSPEKTLMTAMRSESNIKHWFGTPQVDYDETFALSCMQELWDEESKRQEGDEND